MRRSAVICFAGLCGACSSVDTVVQEQGSAGSTSDATLGRTTGSDGEAETIGLEPPVILGAAEVVAAGAHLWVLVDTPVNQITVELDGRSLGAPVTLLHADDAGAVWRVPDDALPGEGVLAVTLRADAAARAERPIRVVVPTLVDVAGVTGLAQVHDATGSPTECAYSHTGVAFGDHDGDGDPDAYIGHVGASGRLYQNRGDVDGDGLPDFGNVTQQVGLAGIDAVAMATFVDLEGDGDQDLFVGRRGRNRVFRNRRANTGEARFDDVTAELGLDRHDQRTMGVAFGDYDGDGDLDLYVVNHAYCFPQKGSEVRAGDHLYRNDDGAFVEVTHLLDSPVLESVGFSASWIDVDRDRDQDLVVINDDVGGVIGLPNALWRNDGPGEGPGSWVFTDVSESSGVGRPEHVNGMGLALGDADGDGIVDMAFSNIGENFLLLGVGDGTFVNASEHAGVQRSRLPWDRESITWAAHLFDHDNDGDRDLYFSGGRIKGFAPIPDAFFDNLGEGLFEETTWAVGVTDPASGKASALVDLDRDGALDIVTAAWGSALRVYHNRAAQGTGRHFCVIELRGNGANRDAVGAIVRIETNDGRAQTCFHTNRPSLGAGGELACHFGLGGATGIDAVRIEWPDGTVQDVTPPPVDQRVEYVHPGAEP